MRHNYPVHKDESLPIERRLLRAHRYNNRRAAAKPAELVFAVVYHAQSAALQRLHCAYYTVFFAFFQRCILQPLCARGVVIAVTT